MNTDGNIDGALSFGTAVDMSGFDEAQNEIIAKIQQIGEKAEAQGMELHDFISNIPAVDLASFANVDSLDKVKDAFENINYVMESSKAAIKQLEQEYDRLGKEMDDAFKSGKDEEYGQLDRKRKTIKELIALRTKLMSTTDKVAGELSEYEAKLKKSSDATKKSADELKKAEPAHTSLRQRVRELKDELVAMEAAGQRDTDKYRQLQAEAAKLTDAWADATKQASVLAHDQRGFQGIISGLNGVSGAFTAAQGAVSLFAGENEDLQKIMLKVQSLMAITMGLQQVQATLDKDSAFRLVTLNGLKEWWNKLLAIGAGNATKEAAATAIDTSAQSANATATTADATAKEAKAAAATGAAAAEVTDTTATTANAVAATTGAKANIGLAGAFRMVGAAIKSIPVFGWIAAAIGALAGYVSHLAKKSKEAAEAMKEQHEVMKDANKAYIDAKVALQNNVRALETFNGTQAQEKKLIDDLNTKYGSVLGYYKTRSEWLDVLIEKGEAYCQSLLLEAKTEALAEKYKEAYVKRLEVEAQVADGTYFSWWDKRVKYNTQKIKQLGNEAINEAKKEEQKWEQLVTDAYNDLEGFKDENGLNFHPTPETITPKAANNVKKAIDDYKEAIKSYIKDADGEITDLIIASQEDGLKKELAASERATERRLEGWENQLRTLARQRKEMLKAQYMTKEGATEEGWEKTSAGKKSEDDYMNDILNEGGEIAERYYAVQKQIIENGEKENEAIRQKYLDSWIDNYGSTTQKLEKLEREWNEAIASLPKEFQDEAIKERDQAFATLKSENFKNLIDWDSVFGDLDNQSIQSLRANLDRIRAYFEQNKESMSATEIKDYTEAIKRMEDEIADRNPFEAMHKSLNDIGAAKTELVNALNEVADAQRALTDAQNEYNLAEEYYNQLQAEVMNGDLAEDSEEMIEAKNRMAEAQTKLNQAEERGVKAENNVIKGRNNLTASYRNFATALKNCGSVVGDVGTKAKNLAAVFSKDLADSMEKGIDFMDEIIDAASSVINAISDVGKGAATGIEAAVEASAQGSTAAAAAGATAISTIEKASVILAVISAALQVATAIASLFNSDDAKNKQIESLQKRIDQLQWELQNQDIVRFNREYLDVLEQVNTTLDDSVEYVRQFNEEYKDAQAEADAAWRKYIENQDQENSEWLYLEYLRKKAVADHVLQIQSENEAVERLGDAWVDVDYNTTRALGEARYESAREKIENLTKQVILLQEQLEAEQDKKNPDDDAIQDYQQQIQETAFEAANVVKDMMEEIIGSSAADIASQLGDAFIEAAAQGEDAMEAWHKKVNDIVADVIKRMMVQKFLEEPIGNLFNQMQKKWFDDSGNFNGIQAVIDSSQDFANGLNQIGTDFQSIWENLPDDLKQWFGMDEREGSQRGIATASQDSVDENNARLTTIQGHTYSLVQGMDELNGTASLILDRVTGIERNTDEANNKLDNMGNRVRNIENTIDDIQRNGIRIRG